MKKAKVRGVIHTASLKDLMTADPMAPEVHAQIQRQRRLARQAVECLQDQRYYQQQNEPIATGS